MTEKEQIEEMAKVIALDGCGDCDDCLNDRSLCDLEAYISNAEELYKAGYRKIGDGEIVIGKEEYERLHRGQECLERAYKDICESQVEYARKETAKEIYEKTKELQYVERDCMVVDMSDLKKICGVEVEE